MRLRNWRNSLWLVLGTACAAGCLLNPQPEPPGNEGSPTGNMNAPGTGGSAGFNVGVGGGAANTGGKDHESAGGNATTGASSGGASAAAAGGATYVSDAGTVGGAAVVCPDAGDASLAVDSSCP